MTAQFIDDLLTPVSVDALLLALHGGYVRVMGAATDKVPCLAALGAQLCLESGNGQLAHRFNWGNRKRPADWDGLFTRFQCDEIFDRQTADRAKTLGPCAVTLWRGGPLYRVVLFPPHPWSEFVAFVTADEGAADYISLLACSDRYRAAWHCAYAGDAAGFSLALGRAKYYTADVEPYTKGLVSIAARILPACERIANGLDHGLTDEDRAFIEATVYETILDHGDKTTPLPPAA
jgi:hypothetical protein